MSPHARAPTALATLRTEYFASIKAVETEEMLDLVGYRPLAFLVTKALLKTSVTPNQVSVGSLICGLLAGGCFARGDFSSAALGVVFLVLCNVLDCADGQLARLRGTPSPFGYIVDGSIDYLASIAVLAGLARGLSVHGVAPIDSWWLATFAGLSYGWQCALLDRERHAWSTHVLGRRADPAKERAFFTDHLARYRKERSNSLDRALIVIYLTYHAVWDRITPPVANTRMSRVDAATYAQTRRPVLRMALAMGPTTHLTMIVIAVLARDPQAYFWATLTLGNAWAVSVLLMRRHVVSRLVAIESSLSREGARTSCV